MKAPFLVAYDYGMGAVWAYVLAESPEDIEQRYPELKVVAHPPTWLTDEQERRLRERMTIDIDDAEGEFLRSLRNQR